MNSACDKIIILHNIKRLVITDELTNLCKANRQTAVTLNVQMYKCESSIFIHNVYDYFSSSPYTLLLWDLKKEQMGKQRYTLTAVIKLGQRKISSSLAFTSIQQAIKDFTRLKILEYN